MITGAKFAETVRRDERNVAALRALDWRVAIVWECGINEKGGDAMAGRIVKWLEITPADGVRRTISDER
ncbi:hypothetical protein CT676_27740 [Bradyrhizobium sp. MOS001]|uniref:hypothetical protein n=1 Tax=Bradyrhizobium sp. MOS001 TaxID=2133948 RepID=UPI001074A4BF|nr:hypothetical protein [Bradyrhizobium sp. MOS001]TFW57799.1 hypothetical protein CT676_27740 [Bradyrhizobium sp. MOS001]